jgi:uncharacterized protein (TIGR00268 family)
VDSSVVLALAARSLGADGVVAVTAVSPSYPAGELEAAATVAADLGVLHRVVHTHEVEREAYARNDAVRCYHCKAELYATLSRVVSSAPAGAVVLAGANADDLGDVRPGLWAGERAGVRNPLLEEGVGKPAVRAIARALRLTVADKPALACLSSRVELGIRITPGLLHRIDRAEGVVRALGFEIVRVPRSSRRGTARAARSCRRSGSRRPRRRTGRKPFGAERRWEPARSASPPSGDAWGRVATTRGWACGWSGWRTARPTSRSRSAPTTSTCSARSTAA